MFAQTIARNRNHLQGLSQKEVILPTLPQSSQSTSAVCVMAIPGSSCTLGCVCPSWQGIPTAETLTVCVMHVKGQPPDQEPSAPHTQMRFSTWLAGPQSWSENWSVCCCRVLGSVLQGSGAPSAPSGSVCPQYLSWVGYGTGC